MATLHRGDVWWADVPGDKRRPVLILTRQPFIDHLHSVIVAPVTTRLRDIPTEVPLGEEHGMASDCAANFDNVFTLSKAEFVERITRLDDVTMDLVCVAHRFAVGC